MCGRRAGHLERRTSEARLPFVMLATAPLFGRLALLCPLLSKPSDDVMQLATTTEQIRQRLQQLSLAAAEIAVHDIVNGIDDSVDKVIDSENPRLGKPAGCQTEGPAQD